MDGNLSGQSSLVRPESNKVRPAKVFRAAQLDGTKPVQLGRRDPRKDHELDPSGDPSLASPAG